MYLKAYGPLMRVTEESWGAPLAWYWSLFPVFAE